MICYVIRNVALNMLNETRFQRGTKYACSKRYTCMCSILAQFRLDNMYSNSNIKLFWQNGKVCVVSGSRVKSSQWQEARQFSYPSHHHRHRENEEGMQLACVYFLPSRLFMFQFSICCSAPSLNICSRATANNNVIHYTTTKPHLLI